MALALFFWTARRHGARAAGAWLTLASLFFYGWWNPKYVVLILVSIVVNYGFGVAINHARHGRLGLSPRTLLTLGITFNLSLLGYFKYAHFFVTTFDSLTHQGWDAPTIVLPLAISFFTFTQIAYLVDSYHGVTEVYDFLYYALFVSFFPHLIAGPIVSYRRLMPQFAQVINYRFNPSHFAGGISLFIVGLAKKVLIADNLPPLLTNVFELQASGLVETWIGVLAYTFQLYFDFSAYSDMAIGLGLMFNVRFPLNFNSPYKAANIADFWQRWHITLSHFLRDYLYIPLGGNRRGEPRRYLNIMVTMFLGGLWHGAAWTFVIWGALHGLYLVGYHLFQRITRKTSWVKNPVIAFASTPVTFFAVVIAWVFFRAPHVKAALILLATMFGLIHRQLLFDLPNPQWMNIGVLLVAALIAFFAPNAHELFRVAETFSSPQEPNPPPLWKPSRGWAIVIALLLVTTFLNMSRTSEFLYFRF